MSYCTCLCPDLGSNHSFCQNNIPPIASTSELTLSHIPSSVSVSHSLACLSLHVVLSLCCIPACLIGVLSDIFLKTHSSPSKKIHPFSQAKKPGSILVGPLLLHTLPHLHLLEFKNRPTSPLFSLFALSL